MPTKFVYFQPTKISKSVIHIWVYTALSSSAEIYIHSYP